MPLQAELWKSSSDTSQSSASSFGLYTPDSDSTLLDHGLSSSPERPRIANSHFIGDTLESFEHEPQYPPNYAWIADSRDFGPIVHGTTAEEELTWDSGRESSSTSPPLLSFENFSTQPQTQTPIASNIHGSIWQNQAMDTKRTRTCARTRGPSIRQLSSPEQTRTSPKLRTAQISRSSTFANVSRPKENLKRAHNMVEKQYRSRLNSHFASLLAKIPLELAASSGLETGSKNVSKAETLALAERYIRMLQEESKELAKKNRRLEEDYDRLRKAWISSGGVMMP
jgi:Helix-loop-helix DNA-binding domain